MPTYEYECQKCGYVFEEFQSIKSEPLTMCKKEGCSGHVQRLFSAGAGFIFKGSGFYITDYRSDSYKKAAKTDSSTSDAASTSKPSTDSPKTSSSTSSTTSETKKSSTPPSS